MRRYALHRKRGQREPAPDLLLAARMNGRDWRVYVTQIDSHRVTDFRQLQRRHLGIAHCSEVAAWPVGSQLDKEEAHIRQVELGSPVSDHRWEEAGVLMRGPAVVLPLVPHGSSKPHSTEGCEHAKPQLASTGVDLASCRELCTRASRRGRIQWYCPPARRVIQRICQIDSETSISAAATLRNERCNHRAARNRTWGAEDLNGLPAPVRCNQSNRHFASQLSGAPT